MSVLSYKARAQLFVKRTNLSAVFIFVSSLAGLIGFALSIGMIYDIWHGVAVAGLMLWLDMMITGIMVGR